MFMRLKILAERVGFEPTLEFPLNTLSKRAPSATRPSLRRRLGLESLYRLIGDGRQMSLVRPIADCSNSYIAASLAKTRGFQFEGIREIGMRSRAKSQIKNGHSARLCSKIKFKVASSASLLRVS